MRYVCYKFECQAKVKEIFYFIWSKHFKHIKDTTLKWYKLNFKKVTLPMEWNVLYVKAFPQVISCVIFWITYFENVDFHRKMWLEQITPATLFPVKWKLTESTHTSILVFLILFRFLLILIGPLDSEPQGTDRSVTFSKCCFSVYLSSPCCYKWMMFI